MTGPFYETLWKCCRSEKRKYKTFSFRCRNAKFLLYVSVKNSFQSLYILTKKMFLYTKCFVLNNHKCIFPGSHLVGFVNDLPLEDLVNVDLPNGLVNNPCWSWRHIRQKYFKELLDHSRLRADLNKRAFYSNFILLLAKNALSCYISKN